jgi:hypothetical protein
MLMRQLVLGAVVLVLSAPPASAQLDRFLKGLPQTPSLGSGLSDAKIGSALREALQVSTEKAVGVTGRTDGYFLNQAIKILMPENMRTLERGLRTVGYGAQIDEFVLSMNRAAERAAPAAKSIFWDAIGEMSFDDANRILRGPDTAATEYFKSKTTDRLTTAFRPIVEKAMNDVGVTAQYRELLGYAKAIPFFRTESYDIDSYVVGKGLDGLFVVVADEERKIRTNPVARTTDLLREVFGQ